MPASKLPCGSSFVGVLFLSNLSALYSSFLLQQNTWWHDSKLLPTVLSDLILVVPCQVHGIVHSHIITIIPIISR